MPRVNRTRSYRSSSSLSAHGFSVVADPGFSHVDAQPIVVRDDRHAASCRKAVARIIDEFGLPGVKNILAPLASR